MADAAVQTEAQRLTGEAIIRAEKIEKYYAQPSQNRIQVIAPTDLNIVPGEILALLGPSGSGKSTILRMLTGLSRPSAGQVFWYGKPIVETAVNVSIVFQSFALFPWMTVLENVEAPLQARGVEPEERRERKAVAFTQLVDYIYKVLTKPEEAPSQVPGQQPGQRVRDQRQMKYEMLPHARPGGIAGLLELLIDKGGRDDIYRLADDLAFEIDDLFPIVEAAQLLRFLKIEEGDAAITTAGEEFANSEILRQKELFRDAALENVLLLRQIRRALEAKSDHTVPEDFFLDTLDEQFSEEECQRQMETAVTWGRYAELFDFDAARRRFVMPEAEEEEAAASEEAE